MPSHASQLVCNLVLLAPKQRATVRARSHAVYCPDAVRVRASPARWDTDRDSSKRVRIHDVEWQLGSWDPTRCTSSDDRARAEATIRDGGIRLGLERIDQVGPLVDLTWIQRRALIVGQDIACTIENELDEPVLASVQFEGTGVT